MGSYCVLYNNPYLSGHRTCSYMKLAHRVFIGIIFIFTCFTSFAQDTIVRRNNAVIPAKVLEINAREVRFQKWSNLTGPEYLIPVKEVQLIRFANGTVDSLNAPARVIPRAKEPVPYGPFIASLELLDFLYGMASASIEYNFPVKYFSCRVPLSIGLPGDGVMGVHNNTYSLPTYNENRDFGYYHPDKIFSTGIDFIFYPTGQGFAKFFLGPSLGFGQFKYSTQIPDSIGSFTTHEIEDRGSYYSMMFRSGVLIMPTKKFSCSVNGSFGVVQQNRKYYDYYGYSNNEVEFDPGVQIQISAGYRF